MKWSREHRENHKAAMIAAGERRKGKKNKKPQKLIDSKPGTGKTFSAEFELNEIRKGIGKKNPKHVQNVSVAFMARIDQPEATGNLKVVQVLTQTTTESLEGLTLAELKWYAKHDSSFAVKLVNLAETAKSVAQAITSAF